MSEGLAPLGELKGHRGWVTCIASSYECPNMIVSGSRDKKLMVWELTPVGEQYGYARKCLGGHDGPVADVVISSDGQFALSGSWDKTLRLWDLATGSTVRTFKGHTSDVFSVAFSSDNRQIVSASRDQTLRLWNTLAECKWVITEEKHTDWISCVRFSPSAKTPMIVSAGWDKLVKVWNLTNCKLRNNLQGHTGVVYTVCVSPDGSLCASGGKDATAFLWDVSDGKHLYSLDAGSTINMMAFSPKNYWLVAVTDQAIKVWDLEDKSLLEEIMPSKSVGAGLPWCVSLTWSALGNTLFCGSTDGSIYVYGVNA